MDIQELIKDCLSGSPGAQRLLFDHFVTSMARVCIRYLGDHEVAKDVMMEGFMKVFDGLKKFQYQGEHSLGIWIRKIMVNECLMRLRKDRVRLVLDIANENDVTLAAEERAGETDLLALIESLPPGYRTVFNLYAVDGYSHKEIALLLDISESASRSQLTHARTRLKQLLRKHGWT